MRSVAALAPLLAACAAPSSPPPAGDDPARACHADGLAQFIGNAATQQLGSEMLRVSGARTIRWVPFGAMITMEFNPTRVTVQLDQQNRVNAANCG